MRSISVSAMNVDCYPSCFLVTITWIIAWYLSAKLWELLGTQQSSNYVQQILKIFLKFSAVCRCVSNSSTQLSFGSFTVTQTHIHCWKIVFLPWPISHGIGSYSITKGRNCLQRLSIISQIRFPSAVFEHSLEQLLDTNKIWFEFALFFSITNEVVLLRNSIWIW